MNDEFVGHIQLCPLVPHIWIHRAMDDLKIIRQPSLADQVLLILIDVLTVTDN